MRVGDIIRHLAKIGLSLCSSQILIVSSPFPFSLLCTVFRTNARSTQ